MSRARISSVRTRSRVTAVVLGLVALLAFGPSPEARTASAAGSYSTTLTFGGTGVYEPSGVVESRRNPGMLWTHNEDRKNLILLGTSGVAAQYWVPFPFDRPMTATDAFDWEDIAVGPCPGGQCVYAADTGRVSGSFPAGFSRSTFAIYRLPEPRFGVTADNSKLTGLERFPFRYPDGAFDSEAMVVHPQTGAIYLLTKNAGFTRVYRMPQPLSRDTVVTLQFVAQIPLPASTNKVTAADIDATGRKLLVRTYSSVLQYTASSAGVFESAFRAVPRVLTNIPDRQGEAIAYRADAAAYYTIDELPSNGVWSVRRAVL